MQHLPIGGGRMLDARTNDQPQSSTTFVPAATGDSDALNRYGQLGQVGVERFKF
ncbi:hypothetical protein [Kribbella sp. NPDC023855]|uniref:hypothetical protein n=1 Tax=Kribbella sp. NPDC023855 TaxID=3154698 RepID=UPI00340677BE